MVKSLSPGVSIIIASHMKPEYLPSSLDSILAQTRLDIQIVLVDSGEWIGRDDMRSVAMADIYHRYHRHPLIEWLNDAQLPGLAQRKCPYTYVVNTVLREGITRGRYVCLFTDDDLYKPEYIEKMAGYLDEHPEAGAVWCSQDRISVQPDGSVAPSGPTILALGPRAGDFDNNVDFLQLMWRRDLLDSMDYPWMNEDPADEHCRHADGVFLDRVAALVGSVPNIPDILVTHRYTPISGYSPSS